MGEEQFFGRIVKVMKMQSDICMEISYHFNNGENQILVIEISNPEWEDDIFAIQNMMAISQVLRQMREGV